MTSAQFRELALQPPFKPFLIRTDDGREFRVPHPECAWMPPGFNTVYVAEEGRGVAAIDIVSIASVYHEHEPAPASGKRKRR